MTASLKQPDVMPKKRSRAEWDACLRLREDLDDQRKGLNRDADSLAKQIAGIDRELMALVDAEAKGRDRSITLKHFRVSIVQVPKSVSWLAEFTRRLGKELVDELKSQVGTRDQLRIESRDKPTTSAAA